MSTSSVPSASSSPAFYQIDTSPRQAQLQPVIRGFSKIVSDLAYTLNFPDLSLNTQLLAQLLTEHLNTEEAPPEQTLLNKTPTYEVVGKSCRFAYESFRYLIEVERNPQDAYQQKQGVPLPGQQEVKLWKGCVKAKNGDTLTGTFNPHSNHLQDGFLKRKDGTELNGTWVENPKTGRLNFYPKIQGLTPWQQNQLVRDFEDSIEFLNEPLCRALRSNLTPENEQAIQKLETSCTQLLNASSLRDYDNALESVRQNFEKCIDVFCVTAQSGSGSPKYNNPIHIELISTKELAPTVFQQLELLGKVKFQHFQSV